MPNRYSIVGSQHAGVSKTHMDGLKVGTRAVLLREPDNEHDKNAVAIYVDGTRVGYVPMKQNAVLAAFMDKNGRDLSGPVEMAMDARKAPGRSVKALDGTFVRSPNSNFPQVEV